MKFRALVLELHLPQNFCHTQTHRHFPEIVKSCSGHPKTRKSIENRKSKICLKTILSSTYIEECKKDALQNLLYDTRSVYYRVFHIILNIKNWRWNVENQSAHQILIHFL